MEQAEALEFQNQFFSMNMRQAFNREGIRFVANENEPAVITWLKQTGKF